jgi:NAD(P)-dependent dehydrogenase (short-subunit alcohol dehydrogenase family)
VAAAAAIAAGACLAGRALLRRSRWVELRGRVALVTGGSRGLGLVLARQLVDEGCRVAICARDEAELRRAEVDLRERGGDVLAVQCDVTSGAQVKGMVEGVREHFGPVDVLINNAGVIQVGPVEHMTEADFEEAMRLHFWAPLHATLAVLPDMTRQGSGRIVNVSSIGGKVPVPHLLPYTASKFALVGLSEGLRQELKRYNVFVTTVAPGLMRTGSPRSAFFKGQHRKEHAWFALGDASPLLSMGAERAARKIIAAMRHGDAELILTVQAKLAARFHGMFPGLSGELGSIAAAALPGPGGIGERRVTGAESESAVAPSILTALSDRAAVRNNEVPPA